MCHDELHDRLYLVDHETAFLAGVAFGLEPSDINDPVIENLDLEIRRRAMPLQLNPAFARRKYQRPR